MRNGIPDTTYRPGIRMISHKPIKQPNHEKKQSTEPVKFPQIRGSQSKNITATLLRFENKPGEPLAFI